MRADDFISVTGNPVTKEKGYFSVWIRRPGQTKWTPVTKYPEADFRTAKGIKADLEKQGYEVNLVERKLNTVAEGEVIPFPQNLSKAKDIAKNILTVMTDGDMDIQKKNSIIGYQKVKLKELGYGFVINQGQPAVKDLSTGKTVPVQLDEAAIIKDKAMEKALVYLLEKNKLTSWVPVNTMKFTVFQRFLKQYPSAPEPETFYKDFVKFSWPNDVQNVIYGRGGQTNKRRVLAFYNDLKSLDAFGEKRIPDEEYYGQGLSEVSDEKLQHYLGLADKQVDKRMSRMAQARDRLNKGYEIYHADAPNKVVDKFEARTPAEARRYYEKFNTEYQSDVDYDLRLRRATGIMEFAIDPERNNNDDVPDPIFVLANRWWNATDKQSQIEHVLNSLGWSIAQVESENDAVQLQHRDGSIYFISADDFDPDLFEQDIVWENFADGKKPGRKGLAKRMGVDCSKSETELRKIAKNSSGEKQRMAHWCANMKGGKK